MDDKLRAWWSARQWLPAPGAAVPAEVLATTGWARSVGGANPYVELFARGRLGRSTVDEAVAALEIHELPSARGCTYVLPACDFNLGLTLSRPAARAPLRVLARLGVGEAEVERLCGEVLAVLDGAGAPMSPAELREALGDAVRNLGEEGRKKGESTTLPTALGLLQSHGEIRRVPEGGRLDRQRYSYIRWSGVEAVANAAERVARRYFTWAGPASLSQFRWFTAFGVKEAKAAVADLDLVDVGGGLLMLPGDAAAFADFTPPPNPAYSLVCWIDGLVLLRRDLASLVDPADAANEILGKPIGGLSDLATQAIVDRGRIVGLWEYDPEAGAIVWCSFVPATDALRETVAATEAFVRAELGDLRGSSLDSPASRRPRIEAIERLARAGRSR
ncbi:hypothetical protein Afil01_17370 [Actinorhabdospora filicis]|uniref:Winged helix DNA-binding domain-containing protein n=1 Tax=Actinorhabdospora filicis TaxID=1785913 RepID=A0A9W6SGX4_9ACTN|nr:crosslink repair DNA glycosylase YcaQ family protein [Actinorhabdospora filicis]GLZ76930.1 hypothetical protein Afil01_17370 [Actinorhabdospora filicis]